MYSVIRPTSYLHLTREEAKTGRDFRIDLLLASVDRDRTMFEIMGGSTSLSASVNQHGITLTWTGEDYAHDEGSRLRYRTKTKALTQIGRELSGLPVTTAIHDGKWILAIMRPDNEHWNDPRIDEYLSAPQHKQGHEKLLPIVMERIVLSRPGSTSTGWCNYGDASITRDVWYVPTKFVRSHGNVFKAA